ncbi:hypothetical protein SASPL_148586 [Salvia splendens]|uniref:Dynamin GTPase n=1 Tax=Salvia splendens TaxID=180675 RepID=A0A8X8WB33_SALSN|nr:hypothetical protein SASPL_148586 [Salvia splendens]
MAKGEPQKLYITVPIFEPHPPYYFIQVISDSWMHSEYFYTMFFQNLMLPEGKSQVVQDGLSRLGEQMVHSSEGKRALARELFYELDDKFVQHGLNSGDQSMVRIEVLLQEDQNVKRRKERIQKQSSILSKLTTLIWQPLHPPILMKKVQSLLAHLPGRSGAAFDAAVSGPNPSYVDSRSNGPSRRNSDPFQNDDINSGCLHPSILTMLKERGVDLDRLYEMEDKGIGAIIHCSPGRKIKWPKGEPKKLYFTVPIFEPHPYYFIQVISDSWIHSEYFYTMSFQNLMLPEGKSQVVQDGLSRLGEQMVHSSEGKRALARELFYELDDKFVQHGLNSGDQSMVRIEVLLQEDQNVKRRKERIQKQSSILSKLTTLIWQPLHPPILMKKVQSLLAHLPGRSGAAFDAAVSGPNPSYVDSRSNGPSRRNSDPFQNDDINSGCLHPSILTMLKERGVDLDRLYEMEDKGIGAIIHCSPGRKNLMLPEVILRFTDIYVLNNTMKGFNLKASRASPRLQGKSQVVQDELSRLGKQMVHSSEGKRAFSRELSYELDDKFVQHGLNSGAQSMKVQSLLAHLPGRSGAAFDAAASGPNPSYVDSRSNGPCHRSSDPFHNDDINSGCLHPSVFHMLLHNLLLYTFQAAEVLVEIQNIKEKLHSVSIVQVLILTMLEERGVDLDRLYEMEDKGIGAIIHYSPGRKIKWPKGEPKKLYFTVPIFEPHPYYFIQVISDSWMHSEYFYTMSFQNLMLPEMVHSSEGKRALALELCYELDDKFVQHGLNSGYTGFLLILSPLLQMPHQALEDIILIKKQGGWDAFTSFTVIAITTTVLEGFKNEAKNMLVAFEYCN